MSRSIRRILSSALAAVLLLLCTWPAVAGSDPRFHVLPGIGAGLFWISEPVELAAWELWRLTNFAHNDQGRPGVFVDSGGTLCIRNPGWCISEDDGQAGRLASRRGSERATPGWPWSRHVAPPDSSVPPPFVQQAFVLTRCATFTPVEFCGHQGWMPGPS